MSIFQYNSLLDNCGGDDAVEDNLFLMRRGLQDMYDVSVQNTEASGLNSEENEKFDQTFSESYTKCVIQSNYSANINEMLE